MDLIKKLISKLLRQTADDIDNGKYQCSMEEWEQTLNTLNEMNKERGLSKVEACKYLNLSRSTFDTYVRNGWIPKGEKRRGFKELSWLQSDLDIACNEIKSRLNA